ncbi:acyl-CoA dehydrogenase [Thermomonospora echinospora]|uniref:Acyl-CoA dehydrogenase n=1 Tax=Thermomonospora echinospora TaxID=1992 RepID=A0A1H5T323_9ACTN|nr:acyl-CoA dehydrogenase family protein [Thermomonospora echinospora]SEF57282.1 acyl-CoA dehydrogenase [Thermomonospora echinospora]
MSAEDLRLLRETVREALADLSPAAEVRRQMETAQGWDRKTWRRLCDELGLAGLAVPEEYGGGGFSPVELGVVFEEAGRSLLCAPLLATAGLAIPLLLALDDEEARREYLPGLCDGSCVGTVVTTDATGRPLPGGACVEAVERDGGTRLHGTGGFVLDGASADLVLVPARTDAGPAVFAVEAGAPGLAVTPLVTLDPTRKQATLVFDGAPARRLGTGDAAAAIGRAFDVARAMLAGEQAGGAGRCLELVVEHARSRVQFGRPIGSFQAVKQKAAQLLIQVESARSAAMAAAQAAAGDGTGELGELPAPAVVSAVAKAYCSDAYVAVAAETIQLHGGIGFTWEHDAHLYFKRAWTSAELLGRPDEHIESLARHLENT